MEALCPHSVHLCSSHVSYVALWFTKGRCYSNFREKEIDTEPKDGLPACDYAVLSSNFPLDSRCCTLSLMLCCAHPKADTVAMTVKTVTLLD